MIIMIFYVMLFFVDISIFFIIFVSKFIQAKCSVMIVGLVNDANVGFVVIIILMIFFCVVIIKTGSLVFIRILLTWIYGVMWILLCSFIIIIILICSILCYSISKFLFFIIMLFY